MVAVTRVWDLSMDAQTLLRAVGQCVAEEPGFDALTPRVYTRFMALQPFEDAESAVFYRSLNELTNAGFADAIPSNGLPMARVSLTETGETELAEYNEWLAAEFEGEI